MKFAVILSLVLVFLGISAFGFLEMRHENGFLQCLASAVHRGIACPENNWLASLEFHFSAIEFFSLAVINLSFFGVLLTLFLILNQDFWKNYDRPFLNFGGELTAFNFSSYKSRLLAWLSFHENSPALLIGRF